MVLKNFGIKFSCDLLCVCAIIPLNKWTHSTHKKMQSNHRLPIYPPATLILRFAGSISQPLVQFGIVVLAYTFFQFFGSILNFFILLVKMIMTTFVDTFEVFGPVSNHKFSLVLWFFLKYHSTTRKSSWCFGLNVYCDCTTRRPSWCFCLNVYYDSTTRSPSWCFGFGVRVFYQVMN